MKRISNPKGLVAALLLVAFAVATVAPAAEANHSYGRRYRGDPCGVRVVRTFHRSARVIEVRRSSSDFQALAGFLGGVAVGAILSGAAERDRHYHHYCASPPEPQYDYYDPYCGEHFASLDACASHFRYSSHPRIVRVLDYGTGACIHTYQYCRGGWQDADDEGDQDDD